MKVTWLHVVLVFGIAVFVIALVGTRSFAPEIKHLSPVTAEQCKASPECSAEVQRFGRETYRMGGESALRALTRICQAQGEFEHKGKRYTCKPMDNLRLL